MATPNPPKPPKTCPKRSKTVQQLLEHCMTVTVTGFDIRPSLPDLGPLRSYLLRRRHCRESGRRSPARQRGSEWIRVPGKCSRDPRPSTQSTVAAAFLQPPRFSRPLQSWRAFGRLALSWRAPPRARPRRPAAVRAPGVLIMLGILRDSGTPEYPGLGCLQVSGVPRTRVCTGPEGREL